MKFSPTRRHRSVAALAMLLGSLTVTGCEQKETVLDIETPGGDIKVERSVDSGAIDVDVEKD